MDYKFFDKNSKGSGILADELHEPVIRKFKRRKDYSSFKDSIWVIDLADMQLKNTTKELGFYYVLLIFLVNMIGFFL